MSVTQTGLEYVMKKAIVVTGLPASGKTTIAQKLAADLGFAFLDKDDFLERLFDRSEVCSLADRRRLSRTSDQMFKEAALQSTTAVLVSHWRPLQTDDDSGTPSEWVSQHYDQIVEVFCDCPEHIALSRFLKRTRHSGHLDHQQHATALAQKLASWSQRFPLGVGPLITIHTH